MKYLGIFAVEKIAIMEQNDFQQNSEAKRPQSLTILCILTMIWSGLYAATFFTVGMNWDTFMEVLRSGTVPMSDTLLPVYEKITVGYLYMNALFSFISFVAAQLMWRKMWVGFHLYTGAQVILLIVPFIYLSGMTVPYFDMIITGFFIWMYWRAMQKATVQVLDED